MIKKFKLRNFQRHKSFTLELDPAITVVAGPTNVGKSAIFRGLRWLSLNYPDGDAFINWDAATASATAWVDEYTIKRQRGAKGNLYWLDGEERKAFGRGVVPDDIAHILNVSDLNFQAQITQASKPLSNPEFWFGMKEGDVSKEINKIVNLQLIDSTLSHLSTMRRKAMAEVEITERRLKEAQHKSQTLAWTEPCNQKLGELEALDSQIRETRLNRSNLRFLLSKVTELTELRLSLSQMVNSAEKPLALGSRLGELAGKLASLSKLLTKLSQIGEITDVPAGVPAKIEAIEAIISRRKALISRQKSLSGLLDQIDQAQERCSLAQQEYERAHQELEQLTSGACPVCGRS